MLFFFFIFAMHFTEIHHVASLANIMLLECDRCDRTWVYLWINLLHITYSLCLYFHALKHNCRNLATMAMFWFTQSLLLVQTVVGSATSGNMSWNLLWHNNIGPSLDKLAKWQHLLGGIPRHREKTKIKYFAIRRPWNK